MPPIIIDELPPSAQNILQKRATARHRSVRDEIVALVLESVATEEESSDLSLGPVEGVFFELPRTGPFVRCGAKMGAGWLPDPVFPEAPGDEP